MDEENPAVNRFEINEITSIKKDFLTLILCLVSVQVGS